MGIGLQPVVTQEHGTLSDFISRLRAYLYCSKCYRHPLEGWWFTDGFHLQLQQGISLPRLSCTGEVAGTYRNVLSEFEYMSIHRCIDTYLSTYNRYIILICVL
jgi:hypothetical protein